MPLTFAEEGTKLQIIKITGKDKMRSHLANLGFVENEYLSVVRSMDGNMIVEIKGTRVAIDKTLANRIMV